MSGSGLPMYVVSVRRIQPEEVGDAVVVVDQGNAGLEHVSAAKQGLQLYRTKAFQVALDVIVAGIALVLAAQVAHPGVDGVFAGTVLLVALAIWMARARLYVARFITRRSDEVRRILDSVVLAVASAAIIAFGADLEVGRSWLISSTLFVAIGLVLERELVRRRYERMRAEGKRRRRVLMIGENDESRILIRMFEEEPQLGYDVVGSVNPADVENPNELTTRVLQAARSSEALGVVVAASGITTAASNRLIRDLVDAGIHVELSSTLVDIDPGRLTVRPLGRFPVVYVEPVQRNGWRAVAKRAFDVILAGGAIVVFSPLLACIALWIRRGSEGPVVFRQSRVGQDGVPFDVFKFRTMVVNAEEILAELGEQNEGSGPLFKMKDDPRITKAGAFLRKTSLDELPQFFNVMKGEMSLVGPRPALSSEMVEWGQDLYGRLRVKPGITGMWQVSGRSETTFEEYTRLDLYYVDNWSLLVDLSILARTIPAVLKSDGAY